MKRNIVFYILSILIIGIVCIGICIKSSSKLSVTSYTYKNERVPESFDGYRIVHLSDLHCKSFGANNQVLIDSIADLAPDVILITGDSIDGTHQDLTPLDQLFAGIADIAPIYAISGNHEYDTGAPLSELYDLYSKYGITNLDNQETYLTRGDDIISVKGLDGNTMKAYWDKDFLTRENPDAFSILLNHYPGQLTSVLRYSYDMILAGHLHGGVIRLPFAGGLFGNKGDFFPDYSGGEYRLNHTTLYVSRGIGDTVIPRINNRPEVVCITLCKQ